MCIRSPKSPIQEQSWPYPTSWINLETPMLIKSRVGTNYSIFTHGVGVRRLQLDSTTWMNLTNKIFSERSRPQENMQGLTPFIKFTDRPNWSKVLEAFTPAGGWGVTTGTAQEGLLRCWKWWLFSVWVLVVWMSSFCEHSLNCVLMTYTIFCVFVRLQ